MKIAMVFIVSFWVITKYRSFVRKTNKCTWIFLTQIYNFLAVCVLEIGDFFGVNTDLRINPSSIPYPDL